MMLLTIVEGFNAWSSSVAIVACLQNSDIANIADVVSFANQKHFQYKCKKGVSQS